MLTAVFECRGITAHSGGQAGDCPMATVRAMESTSLIAGSITWARIPQQPPASRPHACVGGLLPSRCPHCPAESEPSPQQPSRCPAAFHSQSGSSSSLARHVCHSHSMAHFMACSLRLRVWPQGVRTAGSPAGGRPPPSSPRPTDPRKRERSPPHTPADRPVLPGKSCRSRTATSFHG